ncbi:MAG: T9SS type A sorting domain-containing protein [Bacteroidia bacterium]
MPGLKVYPNPAKELVNITFDNDRKLSHQLRLIGVDGKVLQQQESRGTSALFDLQALPAGVYMLHIGNTEGVHTYTKLIKE